MTQKHTLSSRRFLQEHHDNCTICAKRFRKGDTTHLGYNLEHKLINVGDCCSKNLKETIVRHSFYPRPYVIPEMDITLWRFMDFTKFVSLLNSKSLYFTRADQFEDPYEGAKGIISKKKKWDAFYLNFLENAYRTLPTEKSLVISDKKVKQESKRLLKELEKAGTFNIKKTFINCWHENPYESEAMWKLYTSNIKEGVAIRTTFGKLYKSLNRNPSIDIGRVNYINYSERFTGINEAFWFKRKSFEHEKEVRAIITNYSSVDPIGILMDVNLNMLIDKIYISPSSQSWFKDLVKDVLEKYNLKKKISTSELLVKPFH